MRAAGIWPGEGAAADIVPRPYGGAIVRPAVLERLAGDERVVLVVAPPGYGKSQIARQWADAAAVPVAWVAVEFLDQPRLTFWSQVVVALRRAIPSIDDEPALLLHERGPADPVFLEALIAQIERAGTRAAVVIDDVWRLTDRSIFDALAVLVDRVGHLVRFVIVSRADPPLPTAAWRSRGWLAEVREQHLRFSDDEALLVAAQFASLGLAETDVRDLNARAEGWPIGLHLALVCLASKPNGEVSAATLAGSDQLLLDYLVSEVVDRLPPAEREVLLALSVLSSFDPPLCQDLLGEPAVAIADDLRRRGLFVTAIDSVPGAAVAGSIAGAIAGAMAGTVRFHALFRELLESELRWRDPARRIELHRRASELLLARGDRIGAYAHLVAVADVTSATKLLLPVTLELVDRGDVAELARYMSSLPPTLHVESAAEAFDLALAWLFAGSEDEAVRWCSLGESLIEPADTELTKRAHSTWAAINLLQGAIGLAAGHVAAFDRLLEIVTDDSAGGPIENRFVTIAARVALLSENYDDARERLERAHDGHHPPVVTRIMLPALVAWLELEEGDLRRARTLADGAWREAERLGARPHHGTFDALLVAARCRLAAGELHEADELLELARSDAAELGWIGPRVRAGIAAAELARLRSDTRSALAILEDLRDGLGAHAARELDEWLTVAEASCLISCGRFRSAGERLDRLEDTPRTRLLRAHLIVASRADEAVTPLLADRAAWPVPARLQAELLLAMADEAADDGALAAALTTGDATGWVWPFLGLGDEPPACLAALDVAGLHPALAAVLWPAHEPDAAGRRDHVDPLTPRELTLLQLLPTHLSYAQMGDQLFLSVNTIKSNLKSIYRKLRVTSRTEAVDAAREHGLLPMPERAAMTAPQ